MDPVSVLALVDGTIRVFVYTFDILSNVGFLLRHYGIIGVVIWIFGSQSIWRMQMEVLLSNDAEKAISFKSSTQNENNMVAVAASILAQIAITSLSLPNLSLAHWVARGFFTFSLVSSIMAVYYASNQYRILGRFLTAEDIKAWIRNEGISPIFKSAFVNKRTKEMYLMPSAAAVLTISAPGMLLSASLNSFLVGLGVYLGFVWTRALDMDAGNGDSRAVFITYTTGLGVCYGIYALSGIVVTRQSYRSDLTTMLERASTSPSRSSPDRQEASRPKDAEAAATLGTPERFTRDRGLFQDASPSELVEALREAARLRRESAAADEHVAEIFDHHLSHE